MVVLSPTSATAFVFRPSAAKNVYPRTCAGTKKFRRQVTSSTATPSASRPTTASTSRSSSCRYVASGDLAGILQRRPCIVKRIRAENYRMLEVDESERDVWLLMAEVDAVLDVVRVASRMASARAAAWRWW
jgi:hypothetical protein